MKNVINPSVWTILYEDAEAFLLEEGFAKRDCGTFFRSGLKLKLSVCEDKTLGSINLPRTKLDLFGDEQEIENFYNRFNLRFLKGGG